MPPNEWTNDIKPALALYPISPKIYIPQAVTKSEHARCRMFTGDLNVCAPKWGMQCEELEGVEILSLFGIRNSSYPFSKFSLSPT